MLESLIEPILSFLGIGLIPFLLLVLIIIVGIKL